MFVMKHKSWFDQRKRFGNIMSASLNVFCTKCGVQNLTQSNFCFQCGNKLQKEVMNVNQNDSKSNDGNVVIHQPHNHHVNRNTLGNMTSIVTWKFTGDNTAYSGSQIPGTSSYTNLKEAQNVANTLENCIGKCI
eukprot:492695_1